MRVVRGLEALVLDDCWVISDFDDDSTHSRHHAVLGEVLEPIDVTFLEMLLLIVQEAYAIESVLCEERLYFLLERLYIPRKTIASTVFEHIRRAAKGLANSLESCPSVSWLIIGMIAMQDHGDTAC